LGIAGIYNVVQCASDSVHVSSVTRAVLGIAITNPTSPAAVQSSLMHAGSPDVFGPPTQSTMARVLHFTCDLIGDISRSGE